MIKNEMRKEQKEELAKMLTSAIKELAEKPENLENFENYLSHHFDVWFEQYAGTPEDLVTEIACFAQMNI